MAAAAFSTDQRDGIRELLVSGTWTLENGLNAVDRKLRLFAEQTMGEPLQINMEHLEGLDTAGAMVLQRTMHGCADRNKGGDALSGFAGVKPVHVSLLQAAKDHLAPCEIETNSGGAFITMLERMGRGAENVIADTLNIVSFLGEVVAGIAHLAAHPKKFRATPMIHHMEEAGLNATLIVGLMSFLIGAVIAFMGLKVLSQFGAEIFTVEMIGITVLREFGVLLTAILIAGRSGSAFTASIGSMKLREEIDAMQAMGIKPMEALVIPRTLAMILVLPVLAFLASMMGLIGGGLVAWAATDISPVLFLTRTQDTIVLSNFWVGMIKAPFFAFFISIIGCYQGMSVEGSAEELGRRTTMSVVQSLFVVILLDAVFAIFFLELNV